MAGFECSNGCWTWCGNPCLWDPSKSNALLFHPDGRQKTLKERGLGWDDPPPPVKEVVFSPEQQEVLAVLRRNVGGKNPDRPIPGVKAEPERDAGVTERDAKRDASRVTGAAERARRYRAKKRGK